MPNCFWMGIWNFNIPPKLKMFAWIVAQGRLLTNSHRYRRNLSPDPNCKFCHGTPETMLHLLRDCPKARKVWNTFRIPLKVQGSFILVWNGWIHANFLQQGCTWSHFNWKHMFIFICWFAWKWRNKGIFDSHFAFPVNPDQIIISYANEFFKSSLENTTCSEKHVRMLHWRKPSPDF